MLRAELNGKLTIAIEVMEDSRLSRPEKSADPDWEEGSNVFRLSLDYTRQPGWSEGTFVQNCLIDECDRHIIEI